MFLQCPQVLDESNVPIDVRRAGAGANDNCGKMLEIGQQLCERKFVVFYYGDPCIWYRFLAERCEAGRCEQSLVVEQKWRTCV